MNPRIFVVLAALAVAGCANDNYTVIPNGPGSQAQLKPALRACQEKVEHDYAYGQSHIGAILLGPIGALLDVDSGAMKASDIDPAIERCMRERGYDGTSEN